ncbi:MAG: PspC domain-containing protein [Pseudomonadota bacterium]
MDRETVRAGMASARPDRAHGWILGVASGLADALKLDVAWVRVALTVAGLFFTKTVIAAYLLAWLLMDRRPIKRR